MATPSPAHTSHHKPSPTPPPRHTFTSLPREVRDEIYAHLLIDHTRISIRASDTNTTAFTFLKRHLPSSLLLNHRIMLEAGTAYFEHATVTFDGTRLLPLKHFLDQFPENIAWKSIRNLELPGHEYAARYAKATGTKANTMPYTCCIHDIAIRCPGLKTLTMAFSPNVYPAPAPCNPMIAITAPWEIEGKTNLLRVLENQNLVLLTLRFDAKRHAISHEDVDTDWEELFARCTAVLEEEIGRQGRNLEVVRKVKLPPQKSTHSWVTRPGYVPAGMHPLVWG